MNPNRIRVSDTQSYKNTRRHAGVFFCFSEKSGDPSVCIDVDAFRRRGLRKSRHRHDISGEHDDEACAGGNLYIFDRDGEAFGRTEQLRIVGEAVLRFGYTNRQTSEAELGQRVDLLLAAGRMDTPAPRYTRVTIFSILFSMVSSAS